MNLLGILAFTTRDLPGVYELEFVGVREEKQHAVANPLEVEHWRVDDCMCDDVKAYASHVV